MITAKTTQKERFTTWRPRTAGNVRQTMQYLIEVDKAKFINLASEQRTRGTHNFKYFIEHSNKDAHRFSFYPRTIREWNKLPWDVVNASSLSDFKAKLKQYLQD